MKRTFNAVYSVKGGCGKTAFSILLSYYLADKKQKEKEQKEKEQKDKEPEKVCLIDADILGSSMLNTFLTLYNEKAIPDFVKKHKFINDVVNTGRLADYKKFFISLKEMETIQGEKPESDDIGQDVKISRDFNVVFSSPKSEDINKFKINSANQFVPVVLHNTFKSSFSAFMNDEVAFCNTEDVVFDLPPSADGFSNTVFDCIFGKDSKKDKIGSDDDIRNLFFVMNLDTGHILTVMRELENIIIETEMRFPDNLFLVINDMTNHSNFFELAEERRKLLAKEIEKVLSLERKEYQSIYFIYVPYNDKYFDSVTNGYALARTKLETVFNGLALDIYDLDGKHYRDNCKTEKEAEKGIVPTSEESTSADEDKDEKNNNLYRILKNENKGDENNGGTEK